MSGTRVMRLFVMILAILASSLIAGTLMRAIAAPTTSAVRASPIAPMQRGKSSGIEMAGQPRKLVGTPVRNPLRGPNVKLSAVLGPGRPALTEGLSWRIERRGRKGGKAGKLVWSGGGHAPELTLKPGHYYAQVSYGLAENGLAFEVRKDNPIEPVVSLQAATLLVNGAAVAGGEPLDNMFFLLSPVASDGKEVEPIGRSSLSKAVFHVPAGEYRLTARHGLATKILKVKVTPGEERNIEAVVNSGEITLSAHAREDGASLSGVTFFVYENGETGQHREVLRSKLGEPRLILPAGQYRLAAVIGLARVEQDIYVKAGSKKRQYMVLNAGGVRLRSTRQSDGSDIDRLLLYRIFDLSLKKGTNANQEIFRSTRASTTVFLPSGRYRIESQLGWHNARKSREVSIKGGDIHSLDFKHKACKVKLRLVNEAGADALDRVKWTLKFNGGGTVLISQDAEPSLILQAGNYQAIAKQNGKTYTYNFKAKPDEDRLVEVVVK